MFAVINVHTMLKIINDYLNHATYIVHKYLLINKWNYKSYFALIYFTFNIPSFLLFSYIEKCFIKKKI